MATQKDAFSLTTLTAVINNLPYRPMRIGQLGWFDEQGIAQTTCQIEQFNGSIGLVSTAPRGGPGEVITNDKRKMMTFGVPHVPVQAGLDADELQDIRAFGSENGPDSVTAARDRLLTKLRQSLELTLEKHRVGALQGLILDKDGSTLQNLFTAFGVSQQTVGMGFSTSATSKTRETHTELLETIESQLGGTPFTGVRVLCSSGFWKALVEDKDVKETYLNTMMAASLRQDPRLEFTHCGVTYERYRGTADIKIEDNLAFAVPEGVPGLFITRYAPANYVETVNTLGLPLYAKAEERAMGKGFDIEAQSNPLNLCTRPSAVVKLTITA
jgi:hypothetical protein